MEAKMICTRRCSFVSRGELKEEKDKKGGGGSGAEGGAFTHQAE